MKICQVCGEEVKSPRTKYCSDECYLLANKRLGIEHYRDWKEGRRQRRRQGPRAHYLKGPRSEQKRTCLKCGRKFASTGADHRICNVCKEKNRQWLMGGGNEAVMFMAALLD